MKDSTVLNNNPILKEIRNKYGEINQRLISESVRILKEEYNIEVGDIVLDRHNNMGVITGVEIFNLHSYLIKSNYEDVTFYVHSQRFNLNGSYNKNYHSLSLYSYLDNVKTIGNISIQKTDKDRRKLYKSLNLNKTV
tara:strand:- start:392 stop:802 length:411 start_codon:yes stop_codon:yes gene_type:complete